VSFAFWLYIAMLFVYRAAELTALRGKRAPGPLVFFERRSWRKDRTLYAATIPFMLGLAAPLLEHVYRATQPSPVEIAVGTLLCLGGVAARTKGHVDLGRWFTPFVELKDDQELVTTGIYSVIRHPLYLAGVLYVAGAAAMLSATFSWVFVAATFYGMVVRIAAEERLLMRRFPEYEEYMRRTWRMVPWVW